MLDPGATCFAFHSILFKEIKAPSSRRSRGHPRFPGEGDVRNLQLWEARQRWRPTAGGFRAAASGVSEAASGLGLSAIYQPRHPGIPHHIVRQER